MKIDFSSTPDLTIAEGLYSATIDTCEFKFSKSGSPMLQIGWNVGENNFKVTSWAVLEGRAMVFSKKLFDVLGFDTSGEIEINPEDFIGSECAVKIANRDYEGSPQSTITGYFPMEVIPEEDSLEDDVDFREEEEDKPYTPKEFASKASKDLAEQNGLDESDFTDLEGTTISINDVREKLA